MVLEGRPLEFETRGNWRDCITARYHFNGTGSLTNAIRGRRLEDVSLILALL